MPGRRWSEKEITLLRQLKNKGATWSEISQALGRSRESVRSFYKRVRKEAKPEKTAEFELSLVLGKESEEIRFGVISDSHFGSKYTIQEAIETIPFQLVEEGAQFICFLGDLFDGINVYPAQHLEQKDASADGQLALAVKCFPRLPVPVFLIGGNHDFSFQKVGLDNVKRFAEIRREISFLGYFQADLRLQGGVMIRLFHPRGKLTKTKSRAVQNAIETFIPDAPQILLIGHYHWAFLAMKYLGVWAFLSPSFQKTTPYLRRQGLRSEIGGVLISFSIENSRPKHFAWRYFGFP